MIRKPSKPKKSIWGHPDVKDTTGRWVKTFSITEDGFYIQHSTRAYAAWSAMKARIHSHKNYLDVRCDFEDFQSFAEWCQTQPGYGQVDENGRIYELDKDLVSPKGRSYSPENCNFVPRYLNSALLCSEGSRGDLPLGVGFLKSRGKFQANCRVNGRSEYLGIFSCPKEAHYAWQRKRHEMISVALSRYRSDSYVVEAVFTAVSERLGRLSKDIIDKRETLIL